MSIKPEVNELRHLIANLRGCVTSLVATYPQCHANRRVVNDVECILNGIHRLEIDIEELELAGGHPQPAGSWQMIQIPDTQYDVDFWRDVDHEGIGGQTQIA
ncbi:hypothetical protein A5724_26125 [Mycobacterium sp. ACS1612]|uniref:hypothetical protein n=1 Tax=Mycobacterium sp. ACS1612 TaxID=1834117 RepID=UPI0008020657|nr:hypothetical protein [Mycobacterium sp. ACS1612]OBF29424.1 hypothetical protein A5724_26125 [Mycobacterium sp. ACS1612]